MRLIPLIGGLALAGAQMAGAQGYPDRERIGQEVRETVGAMRAAAERKDWLALRSHFPADSRWSRQVESLVTGPADRPGVSFWKPEARPALDDLLVEVFASDIAAVQVPFAVGEANGTWGAVLVRTGEQWRLHCTVETFGSQLKSGPGCIGPKI